MSTAVQEQVVNRHWCYGQDAVDGLVAADRLYGAGHTHAQTRTCPKKEQGEYNLIYENCGAQRACDSCGQKAPLAFFTRCVVTAAGDYQEVAFLLCEQCATSVLQ